VQPWCKRITHPDGSTPADEDQKGSLKGILDVVSAAKNCTAGTQHHRPVAINQRREGDPGALSTAGGVLVEQLGIGEDARSRHIQPEADTALCNIVLPIGHRAVLCNLTVPGALFSKGVSGPNGSIFLVELIEGLRLAGKHLMHRGFHTRRWPSRSQAMTAGYRT
jgi:hypothetical protein